MIKTYLLGIWQLWKFISFYLTFHSSLLSVPTEPRDHPTLPGKKRWKKNSPNKNRQDLYFTIFSRIWSRLFVLSILNHCVFQFQFQFLHLKYWKIPLKVLEKVWKQILKSLIWLVPRNNWNMLTGCRSFPTCTITSIININQDP